MSDSTTTTARSRYESWLRRVNQPAHARRTAERNAAFFLPHLQPGVRLLDAGCGAGSITLGLAEAVSGGEAIGVDASGEAIASACAGKTDDLAKTVASAAGFIPTGGTSAEGTPPAAPSGGDGLKAEMEEGTARS